MTYNYLYVALIRRADDGIWVAYAPDIPGEDLGGLAVELGKRWTNVETAISEKYWSTAKSGLKYISPIVRVIASARRYISNQGWDTDWLKDVKRIQLLKP